MDTLVFGCLVNLFALAWLGCARYSTKPDSSPPRVTPVAPRAAPTAWLIVVSVAWLSVFIWGTYRVTRYSFTADFPQARDYEKKATARTRAYLATRDIAHLDDPEIPYPSASAFVERIDRPELVRLLPVSVRDGITLKASPGSAGFDVSALSPTDECRARGSST